MRNHPRPKSILTVNGLVLLVGCGGCPPDSPSPPPPPAVESVVVRPSTILTTPASSFTLEAVAKGTLGGILATGGGSGLSVTWSGPAGVLVDDSANPVTVKVPDDQGTSFELHAVVASTDAPSVTSNVVTVYISVKPGSATAMELDAGGDVSDWADVEHPPDNPPAALLVQAGEAGVTVRDWAVGVVGHVRLGHNFEPPPSSADELSSSEDQLSEAAVYARGRYMSLLPSSSGPQLWTSSANEVPADPMGSDGLRHVSIRVGVEDPGGMVGDLTMEEWAEAQVEAAYALLERNRAGVELDFVDVFQHGLFDPDGDVLPANPELDCKNPEDIAGDWGDDKHVLYVVYAPDILQWLGDSSVPKRLSGWSCSPSDSDGRNRLVFLSLAENYPATLAHELGHVLALTAGNGAGAQGHADGVSGFDIGNVMWSASPVLYGGTRAHLALGQLYRMNAHVESWLNIVSPDGLELARTCTTTSWGACPALSADLGS